MPFLPPPVAPGDDRLPGLWISFRFAIDYWPNGRRGGRKKVTFPAETDLKEAQKYERAVMGLKHRPVVFASSSFSTVADLFPSYLKWYKIHRAETSYPKFMIRKLYMYDINYL